MGVFFEPELILSGASITADRRIAFVCGQASSPSKPACGCRALPDVNRPRERRIRNAQSPKSLNQTLPVIKGQPQAQSQECLGKYLGVMSPKFVALFSKSGFAHHDEMSGWVGWKTESIVASVRVCELAGGIRST